MHTSSTTPYVWPAERCAANATLSLVSAGFDSAQPAITAAPTPPHASSSTLCSRLGTIASQHATATSAASSAEREYDSTTTVIRIATAGTSRPRTVALRSRLFHAHRHGPSPSAAARPVAFQ